MRNIVITGGSSGIGAAICRRLACRGRTIFNLDRTIPAPQTGVQTIKVDLEDPNALQQAFVEIDKNAEGALDLAVVCAAISSAVPFFDIAHADLRRLVDVNILGTFLTMQAAARRMREAGTGHIIVITSVAAEQGWAGEAPYCVTKGAQKSMVQSLAVELAPFGISVNAVGPGIIESTGDSMAKTRTDPAILRHDLERTPLGRFGTPDEVAAAVEALAPLKWLTGQTLYLDGGFLAAGLAHIGGTAAARGLDK